MRGLSLNPVIHEQGSKVIKMILHFSFLLRSARVGDIFKKMKYLASADISPFHLLILSILILKSFCNTGPHHFTNLTKGINQVESSHGFAS